MVRVLVLLACLCVVATIAPALADCQLPGNFANAMVVAENGLEVTFASERSMYTPGDIVRFYLLVKNNRSETFHINWGIDPQDGIFVMADTCFSVNQHACFDNAVYYHPFMRYFFSMGTTLAPGACRVWEREWDTSLEPASAGMYNVIGGMFRWVEFDDSIGDFQVPTTGAYLRVQIAKAVGVEGTAWGRIKALYR